MRKLILSGDDWFELKHTLELLVIVANNAANEHENMAAHAQVAEWRRDRPAAGGRKEHGSVWRLGRVAEGKHGVFPGDRDQIYAGIQ